MMTRQNYVAVAERINDRFDGNSPVSDANFIAGYARAIVDLTNDLASVFSADNPRFDREKFLAAALGESA